MTTTTPYRRSKAIASLLMSGALTFQSVAYTQGTETGKSEQGVQQGSKARAWKPKRLADGQPDVQGFYRPQHQGTYSLTNPRNGQDGKPDADGQVRARPKRPSRIVDPADGEVPYQPWARIKQQYLRSNFETPYKQEFIDPQARCLPGGVNRTQWWGESEIRQYPGVVIFLFQAAHRVVYLDGRPHIPNGIKLWMSDSRGHWEGSSLVIDTTNSNSKHRLSNEGDFASDKVHIRERFTFVNANTYQYEATLTDPSVYTQPWTVSSLHLREHGDEPEWEAWEYGCIEGEKNSLNSMEGAAE
ncbi:MAG TPA: hypothetical protein VK629_12610 [Steroidobacteraceae bacterium]|nr:hypothetical protein [Steroidobacteraceae bacterium]